MFGVIKKVAWMATSLCIVYSKLHTCLLIINHLNQFNLRTDTPAVVTSQLRCSVSFASQMFRNHHECLSTSKLAPVHSCCFLPASSAGWSSPHPISNSQLHVLPHFHPCPIYLVVFKGVYFSKEWDISS